MPGNAFDLNAASVRFFDHYLKGRDNGVKRDPAVRIFVMVPPDRGKQGSGFCLTGDTFPLAGATTRGYHLGSGGAANSSSGNGVLLDPGGRDRAGQDRFGYDPRHPVPTVGGNLCCDGTLLPRGAFDQAQVENPSRRVRAECPRPGRARELPEGSKLRPTAIEPGRVYGYHLELGNTAMLFPKGHGPGSKCRHRTSRTTSGT